MINLLKKELLTYQKAYYASCTMRDSDYIQLKCLKETLTSRNFPIDDLNFTSPFDFFGNLLEKTDIIENSLEKQGLSLYELYKLIFHHFLDFFVTIPNSNHTLNCLTNMTKYKYVQFDSNVGVCKSRNRYFYMYVSSQLHKIEIYTNFINSFVDFCDNNIDDIKYLLQDNSNSFCKNTSITKSDSTDVTSIEYFNLLLESNIIFIFHYDFVKTARIAFSDYIFEKTS